MSDENVPSTKSAYPKTGLLVAATVLPVLGWAFRQVWVGGQNAFNGTNNDPVIDED